MILLFDDFGIYLEFIMFFDIGIFEVVIDKFDVNVERDEVDKNCEFYCILLEFWGWLVFVIGEEGVEDEVDDFFVLDRFVG